MKKCDKKKIDKNSVRKQYWNVNKMRKYEEYIDRSITGSWNS